MTIGLTYLLPLVLSIMVVEVLSSQVLAGERLALTIYNGGFGLVRDIRRIAFDQGESSVSFTDVATTIQTETVMFKPLQQNLTASNRVRILEQNYENHLASRYSLLKKYLEKNISVDVVMGKKAVNRRGKLLAYQQAILLQTIKGVDIYPVVSALTVDSYLAEGLLLKPALVWKVDSPNKTEVECEVSYRAEGFSWKADYLLQLSEDEDEADLTGWVTIDNTSGKRYVNATLKLIAGDVNTVSNRPEPKRRRRYAMRKAKAVAQEKKGFTQKSFGDYHMYTLGRRVDVNEASRKQVEFIPVVKGIDVNKYYTFALNIGRSIPEKFDVNSQVKFLNDEMNGMGMPLPKGVVRVFKKDSADGSLEFIGEDRIDHTPKQQNITVKTGKAFDVVAKGKLRSLNLTYSGYQAVKRIDIINHGSTDRQLRIQLHNSYGDNLQLRQPKHTLLWHRQSSHKFSLKFRVAAGHSKAIEWLESVRE